MRKENYAIFVSETTPALGQNSCIHMVFLPRIQRFLREKPV